MHEPTYYDWNTQHHREHIGGLILGIPTIGAAHITIDITAVPITPPIKDWMILVFIFFFVYDCVNI